MFCFNHSVVTMDDQFSSQWKKKYVQLESNYRKKMKEMKASMKMARLEQQSGMKKIKEGAHSTLRESVLSNHTSTVWRSFKVINDQTLKVHPDKFHEKFFQDAGIHGSLMSNYVFCLKQSLSDRRR